jgi:8-oxo-dGTP pyrophosphatase MutT (NUDIX family)
MTPLASRLLDIFASTRGQEEEIVEDERRRIRPAADLALVPAAVLVPIIEAPEPRLLLTVRHAGLRSHAGQIAFPGGRIDPGDDSPVSAALREAEEEIGLPRDKVNVIGVSARYHTGTGYDITPVIGVIPDGMILTPHEAEVSEIFEVPLAHALATANQIVRMAEWGGVSTPYYEIMWQDYRIWGVTARLIVHLSRRLGAFL